MAAGRLRGRYRRLGNYTWGGGRAKGEFARGGLYQPAKSMTDAIAGGKDWIASRRSQ